MKRRELKIPSGYNPKTQRQVGLFAAQLEDQLKLLVEQVKPLSVKQLEWQPQPGVNTIGMLLAHLAIVEIWWVLIVPKELPEPEGDIIAKKLIGIRMDDDGLPLPVNGQHAATLAKKTFADYLTMLKHTRRAMHKELKTWDDTFLKQTFRRRKFAITREWVLYHLVEHFAGHFGQILLLKHLMRDAGALKDERPK